MLKRMNDIKDRSEKEKKRELTSEKVQRGVNEGAGRFQESGGEKSGRVGWGYEVVCGQES